MAIFAGTKKGKIIPLVSENFSDPKMERARLKAQHKKERDKKICDRIKAVLLYDKGWSFQKIAEALLLTEQAIRCHVDEYKSSKKLKLEGGGTEEKLSTEQSEQLETHLQEQIYLYVKDITAYVEVTFGITYSPYAKIGQDQNCP